MPDMGELDELIVELQRDLVDAEDWPHINKRRASTIRSEILSLEAERDLLPTQREP